MRHGQSPVAVPGRASSRYPVLRCREAALIQFPGCTSISCPVCFRLVQVEQKGKVVDAAKAKGPIRLRVCKEGSTEQPN